MLTRLFVTFPVTTLAAMISSHAVAACPAAGDQILAGLFLPDVSPGCTATLVAPVMPSVEVRGANRRFRSSWSAVTAEIVRPRHTARRPAPDVELTLTGFRAAAVTDGDGPGGMPPAELTADEVYLSGPPGEFPEALRFEGLRLRLGGRTVARAAHAAVTPPAILLDLSGEADLRALFAHPLLDVSRLPEGLQRVDLRAGVRPGQAGAGITLLLMASSEIGRAQLAVELESEDGAPPPGPALLLDLLSLPQRGFEFQVAVPDKALAEALVTAAEQRSGTGIGLLKNVIVERLASPEGIAIAWRGDPVPLNALTPAVIAGSMLSGDGDIISP